jgi:hypothetical protein
MLMTFIVRIVSHPIADDTVSVIVPGVVNICPKTVAGNEFSHIVVSIVTVNNGRVVTLIVRIVSQPVVACTVSMIVPGAVNTCPRMVAGKALTQTAVSTTVVGTGMLMTFIVRIVSHPIADDTVSVIVPGVVNICPKTVAGNEFSHIVVSIVTVNNGSVDTLIVRIVSQPVVAATVSVTDPGAVNTCPKIVAGKTFAHTAVSMVNVCNGNEVTLIVLIVSQPVVAATVSVTNPGAVNTCPKIVAGKTFAHTAVSMVNVCNGNEVTLIVLIVSQPVVAATVSVTDPGAVNTCPKIVAGKTFAHTAVSMVNVCNGNEVTLIVLIVSQPVVAATVSVTDPGALNRCPKIVAGKTFAQTAVSMVNV